MARGGCGDCGSRGEQVTGRAAGFAGVPSAVNGVSSRASVPVTSMSAKSYSH
ncbi:hypothetical protein SSCG_05096 [Streptomyces clavuligerus]|nr:hypothetical protein SSCG_05096 [Streptomyces clavuligerus]